jgi:hypothetical protein
MYWVRTPSLAPSVCGLSRYVWSVNTSVGCVVLSFTVLGVLFYIAVVVAGTSSYECPFQTLASIGLRHLRDSERARRLSTRLFPHRVISFIHAVWKISQQVLVPAICSTATQIGYRIDRAVGRPPPRIRSAIRRAATKVGHQTIILLLQVDRAVENVKQRLAQWFRHTQLLPTTIEDAQDQLLVPRNGPGLLVHVRNLGALRERNVDNARCVCWVLRNITDPEAIDSDVRLAGLIRWFDGDSTYDPPFDLIVSAFEECFDATNQLYPGMRDRAYFSARAILQINMRARAQSHERASEYPIPAVSSCSVPHTDPDLHHVIHMLECNSGRYKPILHFPKGTTSHAHSLWMSTLFVDLSRVGPNPILGSYEPYLGVATADHRSVIANTLLTWYMLLGGHVEEETFWAIDKS